MTMSGGELENDDRAKPKYEYYLKTNYCTILYTVRGLTTMERNPGPPALLPRSSNWLTNGVRRILSRTNAATTANVLVRRSDSGILSFVLIRFSYGKNEKEKALANARRRKIDLAVNH